MIELKNIKKSYYIASQEYCVLNNINLNISQWEYVSIMWPSGSWKSTLMNIIWLLDSADTWEYILENLRLDDKKESIRGEIRREKIWFIFQNYSLIPRMNVLEQVKLPLIYQWISNKIATQRANQALKQVWLDGKQQNMPNEISGWQKQRVAIARALVISPKIIRLIFLVLTNFFEVRTSTICHAIASPSLSGSVASRISSDFFTAVEIASICFLFLGLIS